MLKEFEKIRILLNDLGEKVLEVFFLIVEGILKNFVEKWIKGMVVILVGILIMFLVGNNKYNNLFNKRRLDSFENVLEVFFS